MEQRYVWRDVEGPHSPNALPPDTIDLHGVTIDPDQDLYFRFFQQKIGEQIEEIILTAFATYEAANFCPPHPFNPEQREELLAWASIPAPGPHTPVFLNPTSQHAEFPGVAVTISGLGIREPEQPGTWHAVFGWLRIEPSAPDGGRGDGADTV